MLVSPGLWNKNAFVDALNYPRGSISPALFSRSSTPAFFLPQPTDTTQFGPQWVPGILLHTCCREQGSFKDPVGRDVVEVKCFCHYFLGSPSGPSCVQYLTEASVSATLLALLLPMEKLGKFYHSHHQALHTALGPLSLFIYFKRLFTRGKISCYFLSSRNSQKQPK